VGSNTPRWVTVDAVNPDGTTSSTRFDMDAAVAQALANSQPFQVPLSALQVPGVALNLTATAAVGGLAEVGLADWAALALPELGAMAAGAAEFYGSPAGQILNGYITSELGGTGLPPDNPWSFLGGSSPTFTTASSGNKTPGNEPGHAAIGNP
jgi:hypothetical protein